MSESAYLGHEHAESWPLVSVSTTPALYNLRCNGPGLPLGSDDDTRTMLTLVITQLSSQLSEHFDDDRQLFASVFAECWHMS